MSDDFGRDPVEPRPEVEHGNRREFALPLEELPPRGTRLRLMVEGIAKQAHGDPAKACRSCVKIAEAADGALPETSIDHPTLREVSDRNTRLQRERVEVHNELDRVSIPRAHDGDALDLVERVKELVDRYIGCRAPEVDELRSDVSRVHGLLDAWDIARSGPHDSCEEAATTYTLFQRVYALTRRFGHRLRDERIKELEGERDEFAEAIGKVIAALDRVDAPQGATAAERIERLHKEARGWIDERRDEAINAHRLLDSLGVPTGPEVSPPTVLNRLREYVRRFDGPTVGEASGELHIVLSDVSDPDGPPEYRFVEICDEFDREVRGFERRTIEDQPHIVIPYERTDRWVQRVVLTAITAGQDADIPFPGRVADEVLREFGIEPSLPRTWPSRGKISKRDDAEPELHEAGRPRAKRVESEATEEHPRDTARRLAGELIEARDRADCYLEGREEARAGEDRFKAQRDASLSLLRWLIGDLLPVFPREADETSEGD